MKFSMKLPEGLARSLSGMTATLSAHNRLIFFILTVSVLVYAIISLNITLNQPSDEVYRAERGNSSKLTKFDEETIDLINTLNTGQQADSAAFPGGRINPFSE